MYDDTMVKRGANCVPLSGKFQAVLPEEQKPAAFPQQYWTAKIFDIKKFGSIAIWLKHNLTEPCKPAYVEAYVQESACCAICRPI